MLGASRSQLAESGKGVGLEDKRTSASLPEKAAAVEEAKAQLAGAKATLDKAVAESGTQQAAVSGWYRGCGTT